MWWHLSDHPRRLLVDAMLGASVPSTEGRKSICVTYEVGGQRLAGFRGVS